MTALLCARKEIRLGTIAKLMIGGLSWFDQSAGTSTGAELHCRIWRHSKKDTLAELTWAGSSCPRVVTHSSEREAKAVPDLLERLPLAPVSLAADTGYSEDSLHELLEKRSITAYIPIHTKQQNSMVAKIDFVYQGDHLVYPQGKVLCRSAFDQRTGTYQYVARKRDRQAAPSRTPVFRRDNNNGSSA